MIVDVDYEFSALINFLSFISYVYIIFIYHSTSYTIKINLLKEK